MSTYYAPDGTNLTDNPEIRSRFQQAIGELNLEYQLELLAKDPKIISSMQLMVSDIKAGRRGDFNARDYYHNRILDRLFKRAKKKAWASIKDDPNIARVIEKQRLEKQAQIDKRSASANILNIYK